MGKGNDSGKSAACHQYPALFHSRRHCKAESAGGSVVLVDPRGTSQECSGRGGVPDTPKTLAARTQGCAGCGLVPDRDVNAAGTSRNALRGREPAFGRKSGGLPRSLARKPSPSGDGVFTWNWPAHALCEHSDSARLHSSFLASPPAASSKETPIWSPIFFKSGNWTAMSMIASMAEATGVRKALSPPWLPRPVT